MKINVLTATNSQIDYLIAITNGWVPTWDEETKDFFMLLGKNRILFLKEYMPTTNASQAYQVIDREKIAMVPGKRGDTKGEISGWMAWPCHDPDCEAEGPTCINAAMRCAALDYFGTETTIPDTEK